MHQRALMWETEALWTQLCLPSLLLCSTCRLSVCDHSQVCICNFTSAPSSTASNSTRINSWVYGYDPDTKQQHIRSGGRPPTSEGGHSEQTTWTVAGWKLLPRYNALQKHDCWDLVPCDSFLLDTMKFKMKCRCSDTVEEIQLQLLMVLELLHSSSAIYLFTTCRYML